MHIKVWETPLTLFIHSIWVSIAGKLTLFQGWLTTFKKKQTIHKDLLSEEKKHAAILLLASYKVWVLNFKLSVPFLSLCISWWVVSWGYHKQRKQPVTYPHPASNEKLWDRISSLTQKNEERRWFWRITGYVFSFSFLNSFSTWKSIFLPAGFGPGHFSDLVHNAHIF